MGAGQFPLPPSGAAATYLTSWAAFAALAPVDGMEVIVRVDDTRSLCWRLRYNGASPNTYKWEFVGGHPLVYAWPTAWQHTSTAYVDKPGASGGPVSIVPPRVGTYRLELYHDGLVGSAAFLNVLAVAFVGSGAVPGGYSGNPAGAQNFNNSNYDGSGFGNASLPFTVLTGQDLRVLYKLGAAGTAFVGGCRILLWPVMLA